MCCTIGLQRDIASQSDLDGRVDAPAAFRQLGLGFVGNLCHRIASCLMGWGLWQRLAVQHVIPTDFCYNRHRSMPLHEGLIVGV